MSDAEVDPPGDSSGQKVWRWPGDSREEKFKRVALSYRRLVEDIIAGKVNDPARALADRDRHWQSYGQLWVVSSPAPVDQEAWLTAADLVIHLGHLVTLNEQQVRQWAYRRRKGGDGIDELPGTDGKPRYNVADVLEYLARQRTRRQRNA